MQPAAIFTAVFTDLSWPLKWQPFSRDSYPSHSQLWLFPIPIEIARLLLMFLQCLSNANSEKKVF